MWLYVSHIHNCVEFRNKISRENDVTKNGTFSKAKEIVQNPEATATKHNNSDFEAIYLVSIRKVQPIEKYRKKVISQFGFAPEYGILAELIG